MTEPLSWLPELVLLSNYKGDYAAYLEAVYAYFKLDLVDESVYFQGNRIALKKHPQFQDKEYVFWHVTSEGNVEEERIPDFRRCERIRWIRPIIERADANDSAIKVWKNQRKGDQRICLWLEQENYLVVLAERQGYTLLWTAYLTDRNHTRAKLLKEYNTYK